MKTIGAPITTLPLKNTHPGGGVQCPMSLADVVGADRQLDVLQRDRVQRGQWTRDPFLTPGDEDDRRASAPRNTAPNKRPRTVRVQSSKARYKAALPARRT